jgi:DNA repair protein RecN (Recombination protein N)
MLRRLRISHFAIIDSLEVSFDPGLTVLTGETGAGKSILVDALHLVLGGRSQSEVVRTGCEEATVEAIFDATPALRERLGSLGLPDGDPAEATASTAPVAGQPPELLIRRVVHRAGRSRVWVNGALCTLGVLEQVARELCDISSQHEHISLLDSQGHLDLLDRHGRSMDLRRAYGEAYAAYAAAAAERRQLVTDETERTQRADYLAFQLREIADLDPQPGEEASLASERAVLASAAKLQELAAGAEERLYSGERSAIEGLSAAASAVAAMADTDPSVKGLHETLRSALAEVEEASRELGRMARGLREDPARLEAIDDRLGALKRLTRKHGGNLETVLARQVAMQEELGRLEGHAERLADLEAREAAALRRTLEQARKLSAARREVAAGLQTALLAELAKLGMPKSRFEVRFEALPEPGPRGIEFGEFFFSANPGEELRPLARIASGGEMSRLMLGFKSLGAAGDPIDVYVFDEVDAGIGGPTAQIVGRMLKDVSRDRQVICITHLPQIAAFADRHLVVRKEERGGRTISEIEQLAEEEPRTREVARMLSGDDLTPTALKHARELIRRSGASA